MKNLSSQFQKIVSHTLYAFKKLFLYAASLLLLQHGSYAQVTLESVGPFCNDDSAVTLMGTPSGGTYTGPGVNLVTGLFIPAMAGPGTHTLSYTYTQILAQLGSDIDGEAASDESGYAVSLSADGSVVAIGAYLNDSSGITASNVGHVRVYDWIGSAWVQAGVDIDGEAAGDRSGSSVSLSADGSRVAIGANGNDGNGATDAGHVRVYDWNGSAWVQAGVDIEGEAADDRSGSSVSLSADGSRVAIGAPFNDGNGSDAGHVRVYDWNGTAWVQAGGDIDGEAAGDQSGISVSLSADGSLVAIGAPFNDGNGSDAGHVRVYDWNGAVWVQAGVDIDGEAAGDESGYAVSLSADSSRVAIGAIFNGGSGTTSGHVRVYDWNGTTWVQAGGDINGEAAGDNSGSSVSLSADGSRMVIGAINNGGTGSSAGHVRVYDWNGAAWVQTGGDIDGEAVGDQSGWSVSLSAYGSRVAIGAPTNDGNGATAMNAGHVRVYELPLTGADSTVVTIYPTPTVTLTPAGPFCPDGSPVNLVASPPGGTFAGPGVNPVTGLFDPTTGGSGTHPFSYTYTQVLIGLAQLGSDIDGEATDDRSGGSVSFSSDGRRVAIGANGNDGTGISAGHVRVYDWNGTAWVQAGGDIDGEAAGDQSGSSVSLSADGNRLAIGAPNNDGTGSFVGHVRVYDWNGSAWMQAGFDIDGEATFDRSGFSVSLSADGRRVAIGAYFNGGPFSPWGHVRVYEWNGTTWVKTGVDIDGEAAGDQSGWSVSLSADGSRVAIGARYNGAIGAGYVRVYDWNGTTWVQVGGDIDGEAVGDQSGYSVSLSADGHRVAIGARYNDGNGTTDVGHVRVYDWNGNNWVQAGVDIDGEAANDQSGVSVSLSADGSRVAIGSSSNDGNGTTDVGHVRVFYWNGIDWIQAGIDIDGEAAGDQSGYSVSLSADGLRVAIGASSNDGNGTIDAGHVRVYELPKGCSNTASTVLTVYPTPTVTLTPVGPFCLSEPAVALVAVPPGGTFTGPGVNPVSGLFDPATAGLGTHTLSYTTTQVLAQFGADIDGEAAGDQSGSSVSFSSEGTRVAIGATLNGSNGHVRVYDWNGSTWVQAGADIDGEAAGDGFGKSVSLSADGSRLAIGAHLNSGNGSSAGHVRIYDWNGTSWVQAGVDIDGEAAGDQSGWSVALSADGSRLAIGAPFNDGAGTVSGHVRVYDWNGSAWMQAGVDIDGEAVGDNSGWSVSLSADGSRVAIGANGNSGTGSSAGHVRVYDWNGTAWVQAGGDIDGEAADDRSGSSVSLSADGNHVAIGASNNDGNGFDAGHVRVYNWVGTAWVQAGGDIDGEAADDRSGSSVSLSADGFRVAIGANNNDGNGFNAGHVRVYDWNGATWVQAGIDIDGEAAVDYSGRSVSLSADGSRVAIGATHNDGAGTSASDAGHVRTYELPTGCSGTASVVVKVYPTTTVTLAPAGPFCPDDPAVTLLAAPPGGTFAGPGVNPVTGLFIPATAGPGTHTLTYSFTQVLEQLGADIDGEAAGDESGSSVSFSANGKRVAIGAYLNDGNGATDAGHVRVYDWNGTAWVQAGADIDGEAAGDQSGSSVSLSADGNRVAIGAPYNDGTGSFAGHVRVFDWNGTAWVQTGADIDGEATSDQSGGSVYLSADGTRVAIGATRNDGNGSSAGHVRVYDWNGSTWVQTGSDIDGEANGDYSGSSISLSADGSRVAIGASRNGGDAGHVRVHDWNGNAWVQAGVDIDGEAAGDNSGWSVSLSSDGNRLAIGAVNNAGIGLHAGHVRVYDWNGTTWVQAGVDIDGEAVGDQLGWSVSLSADGSRVAIGARYNGAIGAGYVRVFDWNGTSWVQTGVDIDGEATSDQSGYSVSLSGDGSQVAIGAPKNDGNGASDAGHVRVYELPTGCSEMASAVVVIYPIPTVDTIFHTIYDNGDAAAAINFTSPVAGATFNWSCNLDVGFGTNGMGPIPNYMATNTSSTPVTAIVNVIATANGCPGLALTFTITVNPTPMSVDPLKLVHHSFDRIFPNPASHVTAFSFSLETPGEVVLRIYNVWGQLISEKSKHGIQGPNQLDWDVSQLPSGIYQVGLTHKKVLLTRKLVVVHE